MSTNGRVVLGPSRHLALERQWTKDAAATIGCATEGLITLGELRAGAGGVRDIDVRNFGHEVLEELADSRNYLCWWLEQIVRGSERHPELAGELSAAIAQTLAVTALAFHHADRAQALMADWQRQVAA